jgi:hypothetical protein
MLDGTPVLFRACRDFHGVAEDAIRIGAILAIEFLDRVQIRKAPPVKEQIVAPRNFRDMTNGKANGLIERDEQIQKGDVFKCRAGFKSASSAVTSIIYTTLHILPFQNKKPGYFWILC